MSDPTTSDGLRLWSAIEAGDLVSATDLLTNHPELATSQLDNGTCQRSALHVVTDWPGHFPNGAAMVGVLVAAGADVNAPSIGNDPQSPLQWAASSNDLAVIDALLDAGADVNNAGLAGHGTALGNATAFGQWKAAIRLVDRGAKPSMFDAAALGLIDTLRSYLEAQPRPDQTDLDEALWAAGHGGQRAAAELLLDRGANADFVGWDELTPAGAAMREGAVELASWLSSHS